MLASFMGSLLLRKDNQNVLDFMVHQIYITLDFSPLRTEFPTFECTNIPIAYYKHITDADWMYVF